MLYYPPEVRFVLLQGPPSIMSVWIYQKRILALERIRWVKPMIEAANTDRVVMWKVPWKRNLVRPHIALLDFSYLVVLEQYPGVVKLITGFAIEDVHRRAKKRNEWLRYRVV